MKGCASHISVLALIRSIIALHDLINNKIKYFNSEDGDVVEKAKSAEEVKQ